MTTMRREFRWDFWALISRPFLISRHFQVLELKNNQKNQSFSSAWDTANTNSWSTPAQDTTQEIAQPVADDIVAPAGFMKYRALYEFEARNSDEISFQPGDIVMVSRWILNFEGEILNFWFL